MITEEDKEVAVREAKGVLMQRTFDMGLECDVLFHVEQDEKIYVISNPVVGTEQVYSEDGTLELVPRRNLCMEYRDIPSTAKVDEVGKLFMLLNMGVSLMPILAPQLIILLDISGKEIVVRESHHVGELR